MLLLMLLMLLGCAGERKATRWVDGNESIKTDGLEHGVAFHCPELKNSSTTTTTTTTTVFHG